MKVKKFIRSSPHLPVRDLRKTLDYYRNILGFEDEWTWMDKDGDIKDGGIKVKVGGKEITVCCDDCAKKAKENPAEYSRASA